jgi:nucleoside-diphosphate-sugar epimerase
LRVLLTGASGFVGKAALDALAGLGAEVHAVSRTEPQTTARHAWHHADLLDSKATAAVVARVKPEVILHLAWFVEHGAFWNSPINRDWVDASLSLTRAGAENGMKRFVGAGTCYEYDWPSDGNCDELTTPLQSSTLYDECKDLTRREIEKFSAANDFAFAWARLFFPYGEGENPNRLVPSVARDLAAQRIAKCTSGSAVRDFIDVRDAGVALARVTLSKLTGAVNIASGIGTPVADVARKLGEISGQPNLVKIGALPDRPDEPKRIVANTKRLRDEAGFSPMRSLDEGLRDAYAYWLAQRGL